MTAYSKTPQFLLSCLASSVLVLTATGNAVAAPTKDQCVDAYTRAQDQRRDRKLLDARQSLLLCASESCPSLVRSDCVRALDELASVLPGIVFEAKDGAGQDLSAVTVTMDGAPLVERLDGSAITLDPGEHTFAFRAPNLPATELKLVIREGDKARRQPVTIGPAAPPNGEPKPQTATPPPLPIPTSETPNSLGTRRVVALAAAGVGVGGVVLGSIFGLIALSRKDDAKKACPDLCDDQAGADKWSSAKRAANVSTVGFVVGAVGLSAGAVLWFSAKRDSTESASVALGVGPGSLQVRGSW